MIGQNIIPRAYDPLTDTLDPAVIKKNLDNIRDVVKRCADAMPMHQDFINQYCKAAAPPHATTMDKVKLP